MTDIVDDLREYDREVFSGGLMIRAADEIERLREALEDVCNYGDLAAVRVARAALEGRS